MANTPVVQDIRSIVNPEILFAQIVYWWDLKFLSILRDEVFNFSIIVFDYFVKALRYQGSRMNNTSNLSSQIVFFSTEEEWVSKYGSLEVPSK